MRTVSAIEMRQRFGQILDEAGGGERIVIERAGQPIAALVPLRDLAELDPERRRASRLAAIDDIRRMPRLASAPFDAAKVVRKTRRLRDRQILRAVRDRTE